MEHDVLFKGIVIASLWVVCGIGIFLAWYFIHKARHQERLLMIEKGMNPNDAGGRNGLKSTMIKLGVVVIGLSIGLFIIAMLVQFHSLGKSDAVPMSILGLCGGISLIVANRVSFIKQQ
jgi:hypothetical protein